MKTSSRIGAAGRPESWTVTGGWRWPSHVRSPMTSAPAGKGSVSRLENNVVMLAGTVGSWQVRATAGDLARRTAGAFDLCNALRVDGDAPDRRQVDAFTELVASVPEPRPPMAVSRAWPRAGRSGRVIRRSRVFTAGAAGLAAANPPLDAARLDIVPSGLWGRAESLRTVLRLAAEAVAPVSFGFAADLLGGEGGRTGASGLRDAFLIMLVPLLANAVLIVRARRTYLTDAATAAAAEKGSR
jgi:hypothetical protein